MPKHNDKRFSVVSNDGSTVTYYYLTEAAAQRAQKAYRAALVAELGWAPEVAQVYAERYAASTGELTSWVGEARVAQERLMVWEFHSHPVQGMPGWEESQNVSAKTRAVRRVLKSAGL